MEKTNLEEITLIGLALAYKTTNQNGQSGRDCGSLWERFEKEAIASKIPNKLRDEIFAVYYGYVGDHTQPFSYFIGCRVKPGTEPVAGLESLTVPAGAYLKYLAKGQMPDCISNTWKGIWDSEVTRAYGYDFEVYGERSKDWSDAEVVVYVSTK